MNATTKKPRKLSVKQLFEKFPAMAQQQNVNCLEDMACPQCGYREEFRIEMTAIIALGDDGTDGHEDTDWDKNSFCQCGACMHEGKVKDFTFKNLDLFLCYQVEVTK